MPTAGTHVTLIEQLILRNPDLKAILGDPFADEGSKEDKLLRFAKLGAVGPDMLYALADFQTLPATDLQNFINFILKLSGTFACVAETIETVTTKIKSTLDTISDGIFSELLQTSNLVSGVIVDSIITEVIDKGFNAFYFIAPPRQNFEIEEWFWADCLHYNRPGSFSKALLNAARESNNDFLKAYAYGYTTHYVTDTIGHPYVNQITMGPYRMHWQRHHLIENFIDAYIWDKWHTPTEFDIIDESDLDKPVVTANAIGTGGQIAYARLNDHILLGAKALGDPIDEAVQRVSEKIKKGLFHLNDAEEVSFEAPNDTDFLKLCKMLEKTINSFYSQFPHPLIMENRGTDPRPGGFPTADDIAGAYGGLRLLLRFSTESYMEAPEFPDVTTDVSATLKKISDEIQKLGDGLSMPTPSTSGQFSLENLLKALAETVQKVAETVAAVIKIVEDIAAACGNALTDAIKVGLWFINTALYSLYRNFRLVLVLNAYATPYNDEILSSIILREDLGGNLEAKEFWSISKNAANNATNYPLEEDPNARKRWASPKFIPFKIPGTKQELPGVFVAPYACNDTPDAFFDKPSVSQKPDEMFSDTAPQRQTPTKDGFTCTKRNFGNAIDNCVNLIKKYHDGKLILPDFDLDGDRGYAWPNWDTDMVLDPYDSANSVSDGQVTVRCTYPS